MWRVMHRMTEAGKEELKRRPFLALASPFTKQKTLEKAI